MTRAVFHLPPTLRAEVIRHALRKADGKLVEGETDVRQAFGLLGGLAHDGQIAVTHQVALRRNLRLDPVAGADVADAVGRLAVPSRTPIGRRGWLADPVEILEADRRFDADGAMLIGTYHAHHVAWPDDPLRDTPTALDRELAAGSELWVLIVSIVDRQQPRLRAFYEADVAREAMVWTPT